ncbi:hypothetical protein ACFQ0M_40615 [Kitasatospora aburaviensis]
MTNGAQSTGAGDPAPDLAAAAVWGLLRSAQSEHPGASACWTSTGRRPPRPSWRRHSPPTSPSWRSAGPVCWHRGWRRPSRSPAAAPPPSTRTAPSWSPAAPAPWAACSPGTWSSAAPGTSCWRAAGARRRRAWPGWWRN